MKIAADARVAFPPESAFCLFRDRLALLVERTANVRIASERERTEQGTLVCVKSEWHGAGHLPAAVRGIITQQMVVWTTQAIWDQKALVCEWRATPTALLPDAIRCDGRTSFLAQGDGHTSMRVQGAVVTDARKLPGVPSFLAGMVARSVDEFLVTAIRSTLIAIASAAEEQLTLAG